MRAGGDSVPDSTGYDQLRSARTGRSAAIVLGAVDIVPLAVVLGGVVARGAVMGLGAGAAADGGVGDGVTWLPALGG